MAKKPPVKCRGCGLQFRREDLIEGKDWIMPSKNWFYHKECYDLWVQKKKDNKDINSNKKDEEYKTEIYDYLARVLKVPFDGGVVGSQIKTMVKRGRTIKGILFALIYYYDIKGNKWNPEYEGIWIAELVYEQSKIYWYERATKQHDILEQYEKQIKTFKELPRVQVKKKKKKEWESKMMGVISDNDNEE